MKNIVFLAILTFYCWNMQAQTCDIYTDGFAPISKILTVGETADLVFNIKNKANGTDCFYKAESVMVYMFLPNQTLGFESIVYPAEGKGEFFNWSYDPEYHTLIGLNHTAIADGQGEDNITVRIKVGDIAAPSVSQTLGVTIVQNPDGDIFPANDPANDNRLLTLRLRKEIAQDRIQFDVVNSDCDKVDLFFGLDQAEDMAYYLIQKSTDGENFITVDTKQASKEGEADRFVFSDIGLQDGAEYVYRFVAVTESGEERVLRTTSIMNDCSGKFADFEYFPNPTVNNLFIKLKGSLADQTVDMHILNTRGDIVRLAPGVSNVEDQIIVEDLPSGVYILKIADNNAVSAKKFVKIK